MSPWNLLNPFRRSRRASSELRSQRIHTGEVLRAILRRERARADRNAHGFSLIVFEPGESAETGRTARTLTPAQTSKLLDVLLTRIRATDDVGWLDEAAGKIAVILPETSLEGAQKLAWDVRLAVGDATLPLRCSVNRYPSDLPTDGDGQSRPDQHDTGAFVERAHALSEHEQVPVAADEKAAEAQRSTDKVPAATKSVAWQARELDNLFLRRMPLTKRAFDVLVAGTGLILAAPVLGIAALGIKLTSKGEIVFRQQRAGQGGRPFTFYKLRTMVVGAEALKRGLLDQNEVTGPVFKMKKDPRVTSIGRFLRKTSIDEIPQLWNVLKGDMTLVGPRPPTLDEVAEYDRWQLRRLEAKGGLTCIWQVSGRSLVGFKDWVRMDIRYIEQQSSLLDLKLLFLTLPAILSGRGAR